MFSIIIKKRNLMLAVLIVAGLALLLLGWRFNLFEKNEPAAKVNVDLPVTSSTTIENTALTRLSNNKTAEDGSDFFVEYRLERERTRGQRVEWLREVINNVNSAGETRQKAQEHLMTISSIMEKEVELENLMKAKGYKDAAVLVDDRAVTVIVNTKTLPVGDAAQITDLVSRGTGVEAKNIVIIPREQL